MKNVLVQNHTDAVMTSMKVFTEKDVDGMLAAVTTVGAKIFNVSDEACVDGDTLCSTIEGMKAEGRFISLDNVVNPT